MKKLSFLLLILFSTTFCFAQTGKPWGPWKQAACYKGLFFGVQRDFYSKSENKWFYMIEFQSRYNKKVGFQFHAFNPLTQKGKEISDQYSIGEGSLRLMPGEVKNWQIAVVGEGNPFLQIFSVCFEFKNDGTPICNDHPYKDMVSFAKCDNGTPNYKVYTAADIANLEAEQEAERKAGYANNPNYVNKYETSPGKSVDNRSPNEKLIDAYAKLLGVNSSGNNRYNSGSGTSPTVTQRQAAASNTPPSAAEVTEKDFAMDVKPYDPLTAKEQAGRFVAGFTKRPGVNTMPSGVLYQVLTPGTGVKPTATDSIKGIFRRTTVVGKQYKAVIASDKPETMYMGDIGPNLAAAIRLMNVGSKYCFVFPAQLAGKQPDYPEGSVTLVWVIELLDVAVKKGTVIGAPPATSAAPTAKYEADQFLAENKKRPGVTTTPSGLQYEVLRTGTGAKPLSTDKVKFSFRRTYMVGKEDKGTNVSSSPVTKPVAELLAGLAEGVQLMGAGSKYKFVIPAHLGYGNTPDAPAGSGILIWEVELLEVLR